MDAGRKIPQDRCESTSACGCQLPACWAVHPDQPLRDILHPGLLYLSAWPYPSLVHSFSRIQLALHLQSVNGTHLNSISFIYYSSWNWGIVAANQYQHLHDSKRCSESIRKSHTLEVPVANKKGLLKSMVTYVKIACNPARAYVT